MIEVRNVTSSRYSRKSKAYISYNPLTKRIIISNDVEFDEQD